MRDLLALNLFLVVRRGLALRFLVALRRCLAEERLGKDCEGATPVLFEHMAL